jgi:hypothetical protein
MISKECRILDFIDAIRGKDYYDAVHLADLEATAAERLLLRPAGRRAPGQSCGPAYAQTIKHLIAYMRYGVPPPRQLGIESDLLRSVPTSGASRSSGPTPLRPVRAH